MSKPGSQLPSPVKGSANIIDPPVDRLNYDEWVAARVRVEPQWQMHLGTVTGRYKLQANATATEITSSEYYSSWGALAIGRYLLHVSEKTHSVVRFWPGSYLPWIPGKEDTRVFLYDFVQEWDAATDYAELMERMPSLTFAQIAGAIGFLRCVSQFNIGGVDIDALEDDEIESSQEFHETILKSLGELKAGRVFDLGNGNS